jgi:hypothetical protein
MVASINHLLISGAIIGQLSRLTGVLLLLLALSSFRSSTRLLGQEAVQLVDAPGRDVVVAVCGECHEPAPKITKLRKTRAQWVEVITDMQNRGLMADEKDIEVVLNYLAANYAPAPDEREKK